MTPSKRERVRRAIGITSGFLAGIAVVIVWLHYAGIGYGHKNAAHLLAVDSPSATIAAWLLVALAMSVGLVAAALYAAPDTV